MDEHDGVILFSIKKIAKGSGVIFFSLGFAYAFSLIWRIILARYLGPDDYGLFVFGLAVIGLIGIFSTLAIPTAVARYIPIFREEKENERLKGVISSSLKLSLILSFVILIISYPILYFLWDSYDQNRIIIIGILLIAIPGSAIIGVLASIFQGFQEAKQTAIFNNIVMNIVRSILYVLVIIFSLQLIGFVAAYTLTITIISLNFYYHFKKVIKRFIDWKWDGTKEYATLLFFSIPLLIITIIWNVTSQINIILINFFISTSEVGIYNAAIILLSIPAFIPTAVIYMYLPIYSSLYAKNKKIELREVYQIVTKWMVFALLPLILFFIAFPAEIIRILFGDEYVSGSGVLLIVCGGYMINTLIVLNWESLIAMDKVKVLMYFSISISIMTIILSIGLIPIFGITGAALATFGGYCVSTVCYLLLYYRYTRFHPFSGSLLRPILIFIFSSLIIFTLLKLFNLKPSILLLGGFLILLYGLMALCILVGGGIGKTDLSVLKSFEKSTKIRLGMLRPIIKALMKQ